MLTDLEMIELIESSAKTNGDPEIPRKFIEKALNQVNTGKEKVRLYLSGALSLRDVRDIASRLYTESLKPA